MRLQAAVGCEMKKKPPHSSFSHQDPGYGLILPHPRLNSGLWPLTQPFLHQNTFPPLSWLPPILLGSCRYPLPPTSSILLGLRPLSRVSCHTMLLAPPAWS